MLKIFAEMKERSTPTLTYSQKNVFKGLHFAPYLITTGHQLKTSHRIRFSTSAQLNPTFLYRNGYHNDAHEFPGDCGPFSGEAPS
jgi:hypothetical protein